MFKLPFDLTHGLLVFRILDWGFLPELGKG